MMDMLEGSAKAESSNPRGSKLLATMEDLAINPKQDRSNSMFPMHCPDTAEGLGEAELSH